VPLPCESITHARRRWPTSPRVSETTRGASTCSSTAFWGGDPLINWSHRFWEVDLSRIRAYLDQTLVSHLITNRHFAPLMVEANRGLIIEVIDGHFAGYRGQILYDLVKASLARLAYGMAMELAETALRP
jgi:NAD(P)-dependent dehydrogenase (short-subunit alcohol dehydrogenase family)